jgi:hypothetical protein
MAGPAESRALPLWRGPQKTAQRWCTGLGADPVEVASAATWHSRLAESAGRAISNGGGQTRPFSAEERALGEETISKRLARGTWVELWAAEAAGARYMSNKFITSDLSGKLRSVADLKVWSSHWDTRLTTCDTLDANATQLREGDRMLSFDLASGYHHFRLHPSMREWLTVRFAGRWFRYVPLPFGWRLSGY